MSDQEQLAERSATYAEVFASGEFRSIFLSSTLSWLGDFLAKAAVTALVFSRTHSVVLSASTFAIGYLPWVLGGPVLSTLADRYPYRRVMVIADLGRAVLIASVALPFMPLWATLLLLFLTALLNPPFEASRSAMMAQISPGDQFVLGTSALTVSRQVALLVGYGPGAWLGAREPRLALVIDALTFVLSAAILAFGVRHRPSAVARTASSRLLRDTGAGIRLIFGNDVLRGVALVVFLMAVFTVVPEGLAAAWAGQLSSTPAERAVNQSLIMASTPVGQVLGTLVISRLASPSVRQALIRPLAVASSAILIPTLLRPSAPVIAVLAALSGFASAGPLPAAIGMFAQVVPSEFRARAFGVMQTGMQLMQGLGVFVAGLIANRFDLPTVVGVMAAVGVLALVLAGLTWPGPARRREVIARARAADLAGGPSTAPTQPDRRSTSVPTAGTA